MLERLSLGVDQFCFNGKGNFYCYRKNFSFYLVCLCCLALIGRARLSIPYFEGKDQRNVSGKCKLLQIRLALTCDYFNHWIGAILLFMQIKSSELSRSVPTFFMNLILQNCLIWLIHLTRIACGDARLFSLRKDYPTGTWSYLFTQY